MSDKPKRQKRVEVRLNDDEYVKLEKYAAFKGLAIAEILRDFIKSLP